MATKQMAEGDPCPDCNLPMLFIEATSGNREEPPEPAAIWCTDCGIEFPVDWDRQNKLYPPEAY